MKKKHVLSSQRIPPEVSLLHTSCHQVLHEPPSLMPSINLQKDHSHTSWDRGLKACSCVPAATRLLRLPKQFTRISKKIKKNCNQAIGSIPLPAMHCQKQMGMLIYSLGDWVQVCAQTLRCRRLQSSSQYSS